MGMCVFGKRTRKKMLKEKLEKVQGCLRKLETFQYFDSQD